MEPVRDLRRSTGMRAAVVLVLTTLTASCTLGGAAVGAMSASSANHEARRQGKPETASYGARILLGALCGFVIDGLIVNASLGDASVPDLSGLSR
jgi:hypothetical protein